MSSKLFIKKFCVALILIFVSGSVSSLKADTLFFSFDEWGKGFLCAGETATVAIPACQISPATQMGSFARVASGFTTDPTAGGGTHVLTYQLPFDVGNFDMYLQAVDETVPGDLIRGIGTTVLFYSLQELTGTGDCSTMTPPATGCDGLADVAALPTPRAGVMTGLEIGPEGDNHGLFYLPNNNGDLVTFIPQSDELTVCPLIPNCGPMNIAPPANNPFRDITGFGGGGGIVLLPANDPTDPIATTPEPASIWLSVMGAAMLYLTAKREAFRRRNRSRLTTLCH